MKRLLILCGVMASLTNIARIGGRLAAGQGAADDALGEGGFAREGPSRSIRGRRWCGRSGRTSTACGTTRFDRKDEAHAGEVGRARSSCRFRIESALSGVMKPVRRSKSSGIAARSQRPEDGQGRPAAAALRRGRLGSDGLRQRQGSRHAPRRLRLRSRSTSPTPCKPTATRSWSSRVWDPTSTSYQPRGKQVLKPDGIWYTP